MLVEFNFDRLCGIGTETIKPILGHNSKKPNFYAKKLGELNDFMLMFWWGLMIFLVKTASHSHLVASKKSNLDVLEEPCVS